MFNFEKMFAQKTSRSSPLPNPMDDSVEKTETFWKKVKNHEYDGEEALSPVTEDRHTSPQAADNSHPSQKAA